MEGSQGGLSRNLLNPEAENTPLPGKLTRIVNKDTVIRHEQAGGGGNGDPLERAIDVIIFDLKEEKISPGFAVRYHGIVFEANGVLDAEATEVNRQRLRAARDTEKETSP